MNSGNFYSELKERAEELFLEKDNISKEELFRFFEKQQIEKEIKSQSSEINFKNLFFKLSDIATAAILISEQDEIIYMNKISEHFLGYSKEEWQKMRVVDFVHPAHRNEAYKNLRNRNKGKSFPSCNEYKYITKNKKIGWCQVCVGFVREKGKDLKIYIIWDISELKNNQEKIKEQKAKIIVQNEEINKTNLRLQKVYEKYKGTARKYYKMVASAPVGIVTCDITGKTTYANSNAAEILDVPLLELRHFNWFEILNEWGKKIKQRVKECINLQQKRYLEIEIKNNENSGRFVRLIFSPIKLEELENEKVLVILENITQQKRLVRSLNQSELAHRAVSEIISDFIAVLKIQEDNSLYMEWHAGSLRNIIGINGNEFFDYNWKEYIYKEDLYKLEKLIYGIRNGNSQKHQLRLINVENKLVWVEAYVIPKWNMKNKKISTIFVGIVNIDKEKQAEAAIKASEEKFRAIFNNIVVGVAIINKEHRFTYINQCWADMLGYTKEELYQLKNEDVTYYEDLSKSRGRIGNLYDKKMSSYEAEKRYIKKDGTIFWTNISVTPLLDKEGNVESAVGIIINIAERKQAIHALRESEEKFRNIIEQTHDGIVLTDKKGKIIEWNKGQEQLFDLKKEQVKDEYLWDLSNKKDINEISKREFLRFGNKIKDYLDNEKIENLFKVLNINIISKEKIEKFIQTVIFPIKNQESYMLGAISRDFTDIKKAQKHLEEAKELAEAANKTKSEFVANVSHEIRTPMNAILGFSDILKEKLQGNNEYIEYIEGIQKSGKNLLHLINDILDLSKIEAGRMDMEFKPSDIRRLISDIGHVFNIKIRQKNLTFQTNIPASFPQYIYVEDRRLRQILFNLVGNAVKFTDKGIVEVEVEIIKINKVNFTIDFVIRVRDTGIGIPKEQQEIIFEPFKQRHGQNNRKYGGTGLGLSITKRLTQMLGGNIYLESKPDEGSAFSIEFNNLKIANRAYLNKKIIEQKESIVFEKSKILLVEDNESNRKVVGAYLRNFDIDIIEANNGKQALKLLAKENFNLIIMDIQMPVMDGIRAMEIIKRSNMLPNKKNIPIIVTTATINKKNSDKNSDIYNSYIEKPFKKQALIEELKKYLKYTEIEKKQGTNITELKDEFSVFNILIESELIQKQSDKYKTILKNNLLISANSLKVNMKISILKKFIADIREIGIVYQKNILITFAETLNSQIKSYNFIKILKTMNLFTDYVNKII